MSKNGISVCFVVKNAIINGYPFIESLDSCLPIADEIVISEGFSDDKTYEYLKDFQNKNKSIVKIVRQDWSKINSPNGEVISKVSSLAMNFCNREWIYYLQADELIHEKNTSDIINLASGKLGKYNSAEFNFNHFIGSWEPLKEGHAAYHKAIRMIRNNVGIKIMGDGWSFNGNIHPVYNSFEKPIYHFGWVFPKNIEYKNLEQLKIYQNNKDYVKKATGAEERLKNNIEKKGLPLPVNFSDFPESMRRHLGKYEYEVL